MEMEAPFDGLLPDVYGDSATEFQVDVENGADKCAVNVQNV